MLTGEKTSAARSLALEVDGGMFPWSSRSGKLHTMIPVKRQRWWCPELPRTTVRTDRMLAAVRA
jgi:hypothetical protein